MNLYQLIKSTIRWISVSQCTRLLLVFVLGITLCLFNNCRGSATGGGDGDDASFEEGPIDIPITIAKGTKGVDPSTVEFDLNSQELSACTVDRVDGTCIGIVDGIIEYWAETSEGCFSFSPVNPPIVVAMMVLSPEGISEGISGSYPVFADIAADGSMKVGVSNVGGLSTSSKLAVKSDGTVAFCANNASGNPVIGTTTTSGGSPETFAVVDACPELIGYSGSEGANLVTLNTTSGLVSSYSSSGDGSSVGTAYTSTPNVKACSSGDIGFLTDATTINLNGGEARCPDEGTDVASQIFDCLNSSTLLSFQTTSGGSYQHEQCDVSDVAGALVTGDSQLKSLRTETSGCNYISCNGNNVCFLECDNGSGRNDIYEYDSSASILNGPLALNARSGSAKVVSGGGAVTYAYNSGGESLEDIITFYNADNGETASLGVEGCCPANVPDSSGDVVYLCSLAGTTQICFNSFINSGGSSGSAGSSGSSNTLSAPDIADILTALSVNDYGMVPGLPANDIVLPAFTKGDGEAIDFDVTCLVSNLPSWLSYSFDSSTNRVTISLDEDVGSYPNYPADANTAAMVIYSCTGGDSITVSISFRINDRDSAGDTLGIVDGKEYEYGAIPLVDPGGWFQLNPGNYDLYRIYDAGAGSFLKPTSINTVSVGLDPTNPYDDSEDVNGDPADLDGDYGVNGGGTNYEEIVNGTNPLVAASTGTFADKVDYTTPSQPSTIVTGDFDGDGNLDLAIGNGAAASVSILLGNGDGTFADKVDYTVGNTPFGIAAGDFDADGDLDLVTANNFSDNLSVLLGEGDGTFAAKVDYALAIASKPERVTVGDLDKDGDLDIVVTCPDGKSIKVIPGNGDGTFAIASLVSYDFEGGGYEITLADFDNDGDLDMASSGSVELIAVFLGNGDGTFASAVTYLIEDPLGSITAGDFDGDGNIDLAVGAIWGNDLRIALGNGDGAFEILDAEYVVDNLFSITTADLNGDNMLDLIVSNTGDTKIHILIGNGDGTFDDVVDVTTALAPSCTAVGDFDGDGDLDLATANMFGDSVSVLLNQ